MTTKPKRIWYQSFTHPTEAKDYLDAVRAHLKNIIGPDTEIDVYGVIPPAYYVHAITELRLSITTVRNCVEAEKQGYDAVVIGHFQEPGLEEAKSVVDIPVIGLGEITMLHGLSLGRQLGLVTIDPVFIRWHEEQIRRYGLDHRVLGVHAMKTPPTQLVKAFVDDDAYQDVREQFTAHARDFVARGVDILIPAGGLPMLLMAREKNFQVDGAPVLNGITIAVKHAELAIELQRLDGTGVSRRSNMVKPPAEALKEFMEF